MVAYRCCPALVGLAVRARVEECPTAGEGGFWGDCVKVSGTIVSGKDYNETRFREGGAYMMGITGSEADMPQSAL